MNWRWLAIGLLLLFSIPAIAMEDPTDDAEWFIYRNTYPSDPNSNFLSKRRFFSPTENFAVVIISFKDQSHSVYYVDRKPYPLLEKVEAQEIQFQWMDAHLGQLAVISGNDRRTYFVMDATMDGPYSEEVYLGNRFIIEGSGLRELFSGLAIQIDRAEVCPDDVCRLNVSRYGCELRFARPEVPTIHTILICDDPNLPRFLNQPFAFQFNQKSYPNRQDDHTERIGAQPEER